MLRRLLAPAILIGVVACGEPVAPSDDMPPPVPTGLSAPSVTSTEVSLTWAGVGGDVVGYRVLRDSEAIGTSSTTAFTDTGVAMATEYLYSVTAFDAAGNESAASQAIPVTVPGPPDTTPPSAATDLTAETVSSSRIDLTWTPATDDVGVVGYRVFRDGMEIAGVSGEAYSDVGLSSATSFEYTVQAVDAAGNEGPLSDPVTGMTGAPTSLGAFGVLGDSNSDEYRAEDDRGGAYAATSLSWVELLVSVRGWNFGPWGSRDEPRRSGFQHNWARSGATASSMIASGQHTGLAQSVMSGDVRNVIIYVGTNDFSIVSGQYGMIYDGTVSGAALQAKVDDFVDDVTTAIEAVSAHDSARVVVVPVSDPGLSASAAAQYPDSAQRQVVTDAINEINTRLEAAAMVNGAAFVDADAANAEVLARVDENGFIDVGGELIDPLGLGNEPHNFRLGDAFGHPGTVAGGLFADLVVIRTLNEAFGLNLDRLTDLEILMAAGLR